MRFGPTAALPRLGSTSSVNVKRTAGIGSRRVIVKVEVDHRGINRRFVLTNRDDLCSQSLYDHYTDRGQTENFIKAFKNHLSMDRLSCHRFLANQFRLLLHALAYQMFVRLRDYLHGTPWHKLEIETLRRRVLKIGARIRQTTRRIWVARALLSASPSVAGRANCRSCPSTAQVRFPPCQGLPVFRRLWVSGKRSQTLNSGGTE